MLRPARTLGLCFVLVLLPVRAFSQGPMVPQSPPVDSNRTYPKSAAGLRWQLQDIWNAAREGNPARLQSLIKLTEIPDPTWFTRTFGQEKGEGGGATYAKDLAGSEKDMEDLMTRLAAEDGEFWVRNINYELAPAREVERGLIDSLRQPVEIFFASWRKRDSDANSKSTPIGYFVFIDGRFRWDSAIVPANVAFVPHQDEKPAQPSGDGNPAAQLPGLANGDTHHAYRPGESGVGYPQCISCPSPRYSKAARRKRLEGTVQMQGIVQPDGTVTDIEILKSPNEELSDLATQAVSNWQMKPARLPDGEPVATIVKVELTFRLLRQ
jgi:TonB family protein